MKTRVLACLCGVLAAWPLLMATAQTSTLTPRDSALHALNRLAYGPRPGEVDRVAAAGVMQWIDRQLSPAKIDDHALAERERAFDILDYDRGDLAKMYLDAERSEEHTSELQSRLHLVCRLLLEKKKNIKHPVQSDSHNRGLELFVDPQTRAIP